VISWACGMRRVDGDGLYNFSPILEQNRQRLRSKRRRDNNIKVNLKYNVNVYCELAHDRMQRRYHCQFLKISQLRIIGQTSFNFS
jgi:hypothetical protein